METRPDQAGLLGFTTPLITFPVFLELSGRTDSDYGLDAISTPQVRLPFTHFQVVLWGVPADPANNADRFITPLSGTGACYIGQLGPDVKGCPPGSPAHLSPTYAPPTVPPAPFLQNPTTCGVPLTPDRRRRILRRRTGTTSTSPGRRRRAATRPASPRA